MNYSFKYHSNIIEKYFKKISIDRKYRKTQIHLFTYANQLIIFNNLFHRKVMAKYI